MDSVFEADSSDFEPVPKPVLKPVDRPSLVDQLRPADDIQKAKPAVKKAASTAKPKLAKQNHSETDQSRKEARKANEASFGRRKLGH